MLDLKSSLRLAVGMAVFSCAAHVQAGTLPDRPNLRPMIWVNQSDRVAVLDKIKTQSWAASLYSTIKAEVDPYVDRHMQDPAWILGRVQLTWRGPNYTDFDMEGGHLMQSGNAAHPTVRFMKGAIPRTADGHAVAIPDLADIPPFNSHPTGGMLLKDNTTGNQVMVDYIDRYLRDINRRILELAVDSSVLYWLTGEEKYARFSSDILHLYCRALEPMHSNPEHNWGLISNNHLLEVRWFSNLLPIIYDFVSPYIDGHLVYDPVAKKERPFDRVCAQNVFRKYINLALEKGILDCNWVVFEASSLVNSALALDDPAEREKYMDYFLNTDTEHQQSMKTFMTFFTEDNFWFESPGYGDETIKFLCYLFSVTDRHYPRLHLLKQYPVLFDAVHVLPRFQFPNGDSVRFGDSHRSIHEDAYAYEMMAGLARKQGDGEGYRRAVGALKRMIEEGSYDRSAYEKQSYVYTRPLKLLWFEPEIRGEATAVKRFRTDSLAHAGLILQRNAQDAEHGMMCWQGGAHHVHAHATGINMELYGLGEVVGAEGGREDYSSEIHQQYYRVYAAHNTVIVNNASRGQGGWSDVGQDTVQIVSAEPVPRTEAVSLECSFAATAFTNRYGAEARPAKQQRTMALIRTTPTTGYYVDIFRSRTGEKVQFHDYIYHNIGDVMQLTGDFVRQPAPAWFGSDIGDEFRQPGTRWFEPQYSTGATTNLLKATWRMTLGGRAGRTRLWMPSGFDIEAVSVLAPPTKEAPRPYDRSKTPTLVVRRTGEAWTRPFEAVYEIFPAIGGETIHNVIRLPADEGISVLLIESKTPAGTEQQTVFSADSAGCKFSAAGISFCGRFAVLSQVNGEPEYIYLGDAVSASFHGWNVAFSDGNPGAAEIRFVNGVPRVNSSREVIVKKGDVR